MIECGQTYPGESEAKSGKTKWMGVDRMTTIEGRTTVIIHHKWKEKKDRSSKKGKTLKRGKASVKKVTGASILSGEA